MPKKDSEIWEITIPNWEKYNARKDVKRAHWFRLDHNFFTHPKLIRCSSLEMLLVLTLYARGSQLGTGTYRVGLELVTSWARVRQSRARVGLLNLNHYGVLGAVLCTDPCSTQHNNTIHNKTLHNIRKAQVPERIEPEKPIAVSPVVVPTPDGSEKLLSKISNARVWEAYASSYVSVYGHEPKRNATTNSQISQIVKRLGEEDAVEVVKFYLTHTDSFYIRSLHTLGPCLKNAEALHMQRLRNQKITSRDVKAFEKTEHYAAQLERLEKGLI